MNLTERKAADRIKLAAIVKRVCDAQGAACVVETEGRTVRCEVSLNGMRAGIEFDGDACRQLVDNYCAPWNSDRRMSAAFSRIADASVNPHHRCKCTAFYRGADELEARLSAVLAAVNDGSAFE